MGTPHVINTSGLLPFKIFKITPVWVSFADCERALKGRVSGVLAAALLGADLLH